MKHSRERVAQDLRVRLGEIILTKVSDPRLEHVSISEVKPSSDLSVARVYFRALGDAERARQGIERAKPFIRRCLAEEVRMRRVPELIFVLDKTLEDAERLESILREVRVGDDSRLKPPEVRPAPDSRDTSREEPA